MKTISEAQSAQTGRILLVDTNGVRLRRFSDALERAGFPVIPASSFEEAKQALTSEHPAMVITYLRLAAFNGLHIVHLGRLMQPNLAAVIVGSAADVVLQNDAHRIGATFLLEPVHSATLVSLASQCITPFQRADDAIETPARERRVADRRQFFAAGFAPERRLADRRLASIVPSFVANSVLKTGLAPT